MVILEIDPPYLVTLVMIATFYSFLPDAVPMFRKKCG